MVAYLCGSMMNLAQVLSTASLTPWFLHSQGCSGKHYVVQELYHSKFHLPLRLSPRCSKIWLCGVHYRNHCWSVDFTAIPAFPLPLTKLLHRFSQLHCITGYIQLLEIQNQVFVSMKVVNIPGSRI